MKAAGIVVIALHIRRERRGKGNQEAAIDDEITACTGTKQDPGESCYALLVPRENQAGLPSKSVP